MAGFFCANCGSHLHDGAVFCGSCGTPVSPPPQAPASTAAPSPLSSSPDLPTSPVPISSPAAVDGEHSNPKPTGTAAGTAPIPEQLEQPLLAHGKPTKNGQRETRGRKLPWVVTVVAAAVLATGGVVAVQLMGGQSTVAKPELPAISPSASPAASTVPTASSVPSTSASPNRPTATAAPAPSRKVQSGSLEIPDYSGEGWDSSVLNRAYCQDEGDFVTLADTAQFRGVICITNDQYEYRGLDKSTGLTTTTEAEKTADGYAGMLAETRYELDPKKFTIRTDSDVLASEKVTTWMKPENDPFIPGDLEVSRPPSFPACDGTGVVVLGSGYGPQDSEDKIQALLDRHPDAEYLRTDLACDSFPRPSQDTGGKQIYTAYIPVGNDEGDVCDVLADRGEYAVWLQNNVDEETGRIECS